MEVLENKICELIRTRLPEIYGLKENKFIINYCEYYPIIFEAICNYGLDIDKVIENNYDLESYEYLIE